MRALELLKTGAAQERKDRESKKPYYVLTATRDAYWSLEEVLQAHINEIGGSEADFGLDALETSSVHSAGGQSTQSTTHTNARSNGKSKAGSRDSMARGGSRDSMTRGGSGPQEKDCEEIPKGFEDFIEVGISASCCRSLPSGCAVWC
jgi:hypothetical protein